MTPPNKPTTGISEEQVERAARVLCTRRGRLPEQWELYIGDARAALEAAAPQTDQSLRAALKEAAERFREWILRESAPLRRNPSVREKDK